MNEKQFPYSSGAVCIYGICHTAFSEPPRVLASMDKQLSLVGQNLMTNCFQWACFILDFRQAKQARIVPSTKLTPKEVTQKPNLAGIRLLLPLITSGSRSRRAT